MSTTDVSPPRLTQIEDQLTTQSNEEGTLSNVPGWLFKGHVLYFAPCSASPSSSSEQNSSSGRLHLARNTARFAGATVTEDVEDSRMTHAVVDVAKTNKDAISDLRSKISKRVGRKGKVPHVVSLEWVEESWKEKTLLDEESMFPGSSMVDQVRLVRMLTIGFPDGRVCADI